MTLLSEPFLKLKFKTHPAAVFNTAFTHHNGSNKSWELIKIIFLCKFAAGVEREKRGTEEDSHSQAPDILIACEGGLIEIIVQSQLI